MDNRSKKDTTVIFGTLLVTSVILAFVLSPLRGTYFNNTNFMEKAVSLSGIDNGKMKKARILTSLIYELTELNMAANSTTKSNLSSTSWADKGKVKENTMNKLQILYDVMNAEGNFNSEPRAFSGNRSKSMTSTGLNETNFNVYADISKKSSSTNTNASYASYTTSTTDLSAVLSKSETKFNARGAGGPPPDSGSDIPTGPTHVGPLGTLPVGNGVNFLLILGIAYSVWKNRSLITA